MSVSLFPVAAHGSHNHFNTSETLSEMPGREETVNVSLCSFSEGSPFFTAEESQKCPISLVLQQLFIMYQGT